MRVLIVDDDEDVADSIAAWLEMEGHTARGVTDASAVPAAVEDLRPDVVLQDVNMPGLDLAATVHKTKALVPGVRVLLFTGDVHADDLAASSGADGVLDKTADVDTMVRRITG